MFHQPLHSLCSTTINTIPLDSYELSISYVEELGADTVEFPHAHPKEYEIYYVMEGSLNGFINDEWVHVSAGKFLFVNKGVLHNILYEPHKPKKYFVMIFSINQSLAVSPNISSSDSEIKQLEAFFKKIAEHNYLICKDSNHSCDYIKKIYEEFERKDWGWSFQLKFLYAAFTFSILKNFVQPIAHTNYNADQNLPIELTKYLHANYPNPDLSLQDMADHFYMSARHINRLFKEYFGSSPSKTLTRYRINYVKNYLQETDYSLDMIAEKVGLSSASTLSRLFKEMEGITISEYRQLCNQQKDIVQEQMSDN